jgi:hypothetical protein
MHSGGCAGCSNIHYLYGMVKAYWQRRLRRGCVSHWREDWSKSGTYYVRDHFSLRRVLDEFLFYSPRSENDPASAWLRRQIVGDDCCSVVMNFRIVCLRRTPAVHRPKRICEDLYIFESVRMSLHRIFPRFHARRVGTLNGVHHLPVDLCLSCFLLLGLRRLLCRRLHADGVCLRMIAPTGAFPAAPGSTPDSTTLGY